MAAVEERSWPQVLTALLRGEHLDRASTAWAMDQVMAGDATPVQVAGFLVALRAKGETVDELAGLVDVMLQRAVRIEVPGPSVDVVGTGGDRHRTVNISTMAALVVAGAGVRVVKHGNRAASSSSGSADVLEVLGVRLDLPPERVAEVALEVGITFCFAQVFHPSFRHAGQARRELGVATTFNFLGPLTNPASPGAGAIGCADARMAPVMAGVLADRGASALVVRGDDGLDELSTASPSSAWAVRDGAVVPLRVHPGALGLAPARLEDLRGADATHNARVAREVLRGAHGPVRDAVLLNAAAGLVVAGVAGDGWTTQEGLLEALAHGVRLAAESVDGGAAEAALERWVAATR